MKKLFALLLAICMVLSMAACGSKKDTKTSSTAEKTTEAATEKKSTEAEQTTEAATEKKSTEAEQTTEAATEATFDAKSITNGVKLTIAVPEQSKVSNYDQLKKTLAIEEALGVNLEFVTYPAADYASKLNFLVESGDTLPDIIFMPTNKYTSWIDQDVVLPLNKYYEDKNYTARLHAAAEKQGTDVDLYMADAEGTIYGYPQFGASLGGVVAQKMWIYTPWLTAIGAEVPTTAEEFYEVCKKLAGNDLNGNGKLDELMISGCNSGGGQTWLNYLMTPFVYAHDSNYLVADNGTLSFAYTSEGWKEGLQYIRKFFDEGIFSSEILTQNADQYWAQVYSEKPSVFSFVYYSYANAQLENKIGYDCIPALENAAGEAYAYYKTNIPNATNPGAIITTDCKNPDAAALVIDYFYDEALCISERYGEQGVNWDYWEDAKVDNKNNYEAAFPGYEISIYLYDNDQFWQSTDAQNVSFLQKCPFFVSEYIFSGIATKKTGDDAKEQLSIDTTKKVNTAVVECFNYKPEESIAYLPLTAEESARVAQLKSTITSYVSQCRAEFITGVKNIDKEWDSYLAELKKMGVDELLNIYQTSYNRVK